MNHAQMENDFIRPIFEKDYVPVVMALNENFIPVLSVFLLSVIDHSEKTHNYDFVILSRGISKENKRRILNLIHNHKNFSIRFINVSKYFKGKKLFIHEHFSIETYFRLLIPDKLSAYSKVLYLDADMIVNRDIYDLYHVDLEDCTLGAVRDIGLLSFAIEYKDTRRTLKKIVKMKNIYQYFNAGVMIINVKKLAGKYSFAQLLQIAASRKWPTVDQDVLNHLFEGETKILDMSWNVMFDYMDRMKMTRKLGAKYYMEYMEARKHPYIIHFAGSPKPWQDPDADFGEYFWKYARQSDFYEQILYQMTQYCRKYEYL